MICSATGKVKHATQQSALKHARSLAKGRKGLVFPYLCRRCNAWHVGHQWTAKAAATSRGKVKKRNANSTASDSGNRSA
jgi:hypothetical protein